MPLPASVSPPCVPVSTSETHGPDSETRVTAIGQQAAALDVLFSWGWVLGCDGELLPPRAWRRYAE